MGVPIVASTEGGMLKAKFRDVNAVPQTVKASGPSNFYGFQVENNQSPTADTWIQFFDKANPNPGTDSPDKEFKCPPGSTRISFQPQGVGFSTAITVVATTAEKGGAGSAKGVQLFVDYV